MKRLNDADMMLKPTLCTVFSLHLDSSFAHVATPDVP